MFREIVCLIFTSLLFMACSSCNLPAENDDSSAGNDYPFATWEDCSQEPDAHPCNFTLKDQHGNDVSLYDFYGDTIVLDFSVMWCGPCKVAAMETQSVKDAFESEGFTYITVLIETPSGNPPTSEDCASWADAYGIKEPVLAGSRDMLESTTPGGWPISGWPTFFFITDEMVLHTSMRGFSAAQLDMLIQDTMSK